MSPLLKDVTPSGGQIPSVEGDFSTKLKIVMYHFSNRKKERQFVKKPELGIEKNWKELE